MKSQRWQTVGGNAKVALIAMLLTPLVAVIFLSTPTFADDGANKSLATDNSNTSKLETPETETSKEAIQETPVVTDEPEEVEPPVTEPPVTPEPPVIAAPGTPVVTSPPNDKEIIWEWTPAVPPTPTVPSQPTEPEVPAEEAPVEQPPVEEVPPAKPPVYTGYGWELSKDGTSVDSGQVGLDVLKWKTKVLVDGTYTFRVWTIAEGDLKSAWSEAHTTIKTPIVPPVIFVPIKESEFLPPAATALRSYEKPVNIVYAASNNDDAVVTVPASDTLQNTQVLSAQSDSGQEAVAAVVKPSTQGWVLFNVPWYVWLLVAAIIFTTYRWVRVVTARNSN